MVELDQLEEGETTDQFNCPDCGAEVRVVSVHDSSFEYECLSSDCGRNAVQFL